MEVVLALHAPLLELVELLEILYAVDLFSKLLTIKTIKIRIKVSLYIVKKSERGERGGKSKRKERKETRSERRGERRGRGNSTSLGSKACSKHSRSVAASTVSKPHLR